MLISSKLYRLFNGDIYCYRSGVDQLKQTTKQKIHILFKPCLTTIILNSYVFVSDRRREEVTYDQEWHLVATVPLGKSNLSYMK